MSLDIQTQILTVVRHYVGTPPSRITPSTYGHICQQIMGVPGVASVALHCDKDAGTIDASVELASGDVITVNITEAPADPIVTLAQELADAIDSSHGGLSFSKGGILRAVVDGIAGIVHKRDLKIADLEARLAAGYANLAANIAVLEVRLTSNTIYPTINPYQPTLTPIGQTICFTPPTTCIGTAHQTA